MFLKGCKKRIPMTSNQNHSIKPNLWGFFFPIKGCITGLFLFVNVLRIRAAPASTLSVHFGLARCHLIISGLSALSLRTEIPPWLLDCIALPQCFSSGSLLLSDRCPSTLSHPVRPVKSYIRLPEWPQVILSSVLFSVKQCPPREGDWGKDTHSWNLSGQTR